ncbi:uncharacterized protein LOC135829261 [Sycon ciliatum]|uniref:uncharacterized protein LOC135829261 n=1 Tax=Sycon ciliatum TaxID=27933 RepID=UPI0031F6813E
MDENPFDSEEFVCDIQLWIQRLDPDQFRKLVQRRGLIKDRDLIDDLKLIQAQQGGAAHNAKVVSILDPGEMDTYQGLCNVILKMGYTDRYHQMIQLLPQDRVQQVTPALSSSVAAKQPESANAIAARADPPVTMPTEKGMTTAAASAGYAAYHSNAGTKSSWPDGQQLAPLCPPMKSRTAAARPGAEAGEAAATAAVAGAAAGAMAGVAETDAVASSATVLTPQVSLQARLPIGISERVRGETAESELGATATVSAVPALHHCHYPGAQPPLALQLGAALACSSPGRLPSSMSGPSPTAETTIGLSQTCLSASTQATTTHPIASSANTSTGRCAAVGNAAERGTALQQSTQPPASVHLENTAQLAAAAVVRHASSLPLEPQAKRALLSNVGRAFTEEMSRHIDYVSAPSMARTSPGAQQPLALQLGAALACSSPGRLPSSMSGPSTTAETTIGLSQTCLSASTQATTTHPIASSANTSTGRCAAVGNAAERGTALQQSTQPPASVHLENTAQLAAAAVVRHASSLPLEPQAKRALLSNVGRAFTEEMSRHIDYVSAPSMAHTSPGAQQPLALQLGAALACSSPGRLPSSMSGPSTTAETTIGLSQTCLSASTQATTTHPIASSANTSTGRCAAVGNAAERGTALQQSTQPQASVHLENTAQLAAAAVVRHASSLPLEPQAKRALLSNVGRAFTEEMSRHIDYVSAPSMARTSPDSQASLLQKSQFLLDSPEMSEGDSGFSGSAASSDTEEWTEDDLRNARVTVFMDSKLRTSADCDGIILDSLSKQHFNETNIRIKSTSRRSDPALTRVEGKGGDIRTLVKIIINGQPDDYTKHRIRREVIEDLEDLTFSKNQIQVIYKGDWDSIQVVLLLPMRTLGHLLFLAVHYPGLLRGLDILQIIDISSLTIIDFREITGNSSSSNMALDELLDDDGELSEDYDDDEDEDVDVEDLPQGYDKDKYGYESEVNEMEFSRRADTADAAERHISQQEYDQLNDRSMDFQSVLAAIMGSHRKDQNFLTAISASIANKMLSSNTARLVALTHRRKKELAAPQDRPVFLTSPERIERLTTELKKTTLEQQPVAEKEQISPVEKPISSVEMPISPRKRHRPPTQIPWRTSRTPNEHSERGDTPLHDAAWRGNLEVCQALIAGGADCKIKNERGDTPLHDAVRRDNLEVCQALIAGGADCNIKNEHGDTPLHDAASIGKLDVCQALLAAGADCNIKNEDGDTPLHKAIWGGIEVFQALLAAVADCNIKNTHGDTPLHHATSIGKLDMCQALLAAGADCNIKNERGNTPVHYAAHRGKLEVCQALVAAGADCNIKNTCGDTPLHRAASLGKLDVCQALLAAGADCNIKNECRESPSCQNLSPQQAPTEQ